MAAPDSAAWKGMKDWLPPKRTSQSSRKMDTALLEMLLSLGLSAVALWWAMRVLKNAQNPVTSSQRAAKKRLCQALGIAPSELQLDEHEYAHISKIMLPQHIAVTLQDVAGSDDILAQLRRDIAFSCSVRPTSATSLLAGSKGLLLYGPPGTGKTMIASAFAREIGAVLINVRGSTLFSKWVGESERLTSALFSLAAKLSAANLTTILFVDEVDALLGDRGSSMEHETSRNMRTEFMQLWDGLLKSRRVLVVAATNQPDRLPDAIWRRFSSHFEVPLPGVDARGQILRKSLMKLRVELNQDLVKSFLMADIHPLRRIAQLTPRYSGSDLVEICKQAARHCVLEHMKRSKLPPCSSDTAAREMGSSSNGTSGGRNRNGNSLSKLPIRGAMSWSSLGNLMQWGARDEGEAAQSMGGEVEQKGDIVHEGEVYGDADASVQVEVARVAQQAQLSEAALIKCVSEVKAAANAARKSYNRAETFGMKRGSEPGGTDGPDDIPNSEAVFQLLAALAKQRQP